MIFFFQAEDGIRDLTVTGVQTCALPISTPFRSKQIVGRLARGASIDAARAELLARWPSVQAATLPAALPETERQALLRQDRESGGEGKRVGLGGRRII